MLPKGVFVDWVSMSQEYPEGGLPLVDNGVVWATDDEGEVQWRTVRAKRHEGSWETSIAVRSDGHRVTLSGNLSRFGRTDNVFGFGLGECVQRANQVLAEYGLPPFTAGSCIQRTEHERALDAHTGTVVCDLDQPAKHKTVWTGARFSRLDVTCNFESGSAENAHAFMQWLGTQHNGRKAGRTMVQGETVDWGRGSRHNYWKAYVKAAELRHHKCADQALVEYCTEVGLIRFEGTIKSTSLIQMQAAYLGDYLRGNAMGRVIEMFEDRAAVLSRAEHSVDEVAQLPRHLRATARDYLAGMDVASMVSRATFYRHRSALLPFGIDLAVRNVQPFVPRVRVIELTRAVAPTWYEYQHAA